MLTKSLEQVFHILNSRGKKKERKPKGYASAMTVQH